jgi:hypothetical protein
MSDDSRGDDDLAEIEAMLRQLDPHDLADSPPPPPEVWEGIQRQLAGGHAQVVELAGRRDRRWGWVAGMAAAAVLIVAGALVVTRDGDGDATLLSTAALVHDPEQFDPLGAGASATAELLEADGAYEIKLSQAELPAVSGDDDLELWLIEPDATGAPVDVQPISLVDPDEPGTYRVPAGLDPATHYVVDISIEPRDGDEAHSGRSILRGALDLR